jgi:hypothetical protein
MRNDLRQGVGIRAALCRLWILGPTISSRIQVNVFACLVFVGWFLACDALAQPTITVTIGAASPKARPIPEDFVGMSFGMKVLPPNSKGEHFFSPSNAPLVTLVRNLGIKHLRLGGTTVEWPAETRIPDTTDIDNLFLFARAAGIPRLIYSFRLLETNSSLNYAATNAAIAKYIWTHYREALDCFAIGNEPDKRDVFAHDFAITNFATYVQKWRAFAATITNAVPEARFTGPDATSGASLWTTSFAEAEKDSGLVTYINEHFYVGARGRGVAAEDGINRILSPAWLTANQRIYDKVMAPVAAAGFPLRFTEANDHYSGGVPGASDTYAGALWALDFLHWWAAHGAAGVNFHNTQWVVNDIITPDATGQLTINPKGYGLKAFELGSHGHSEPATLANPDKLNLTAYSVADQKQRFVTLINKEHGPTAREATVTIVTPDKPTRSEVISLIAPDADVAAKIGVSLGGATISNNSPWQRKWTPLPAESPCVVKVAPASAVIVRLSRQ